MHYFIVGNFQQIAAEFSLTLVFAVFLTLLSGTWPHPLSEMTIRNDLQCRLILVIEAVKNFLGSCFNCLLQRLVFWQRLLSFIAHVHNPFEVKTGSCCSNLANGTSANEHTQPKLQNDLAVSMAKENLCVNTHPLYTVVQGWHDIHRVRKKKSLQYFMCNFNKFKDIFIIFDTNHPETTLY